MKKGIIDFLYSKEDCLKIRDLYQDKELQPLLQQQIGRKILDNKKTFIDANAIDVLAMICLNSPFTQDASECLAVSVFICRGVKNLEPIPLVTESSGLDLASKTLVSLSFFKPALIKRWQQRGAPSPDYYRRVSQIIFLKNGYTNLAKHHRHWEEFLFEWLV